MYLSLTTLTPKDLKELKEELITIRSYLHKHKWIKGHKGTPYTGVCLIGAMDYSKCYNLRNTNVISDSIEIITGRNDLSIPFFNDLESTTKKDIRNVLTNAIQRIETAIEEKSNVSL